jgi:hypothetical protein
MTPAPVACAAPACDNPVPRRRGPGRPAVYCSITCRPKHRRPGILVEVDHPDNSPDGRPVSRVWSVRLRRGQEVVVIADDLGWPSANALAGALDDLLRPPSRQRGGTIE